MIRPGACHCLCCADVGSVRKRFVSVKLLHVLRVHSCPCLSFFVFSSAREFVFVFIFLSFFFSLMKFLLSDGIKGHLTPKINSTENIQTMQTKSILK